MTTTLDRHATYLMRAYAPPRRVFVRGEGVYLYDEAGRRYLDCLAGIACVGLGHANPVVAEAIADQARTLGLVSNYFTTPPQVALAERLAPLLAPDARVFFTNSGTEANEAAFKLSRLTGRRKLVAAEGSFHGRSMGSLALTWTPAYRQPYEPLPGDVTFVPYGDADALSAAVDDDTAAIVLESIQGENGVVVPPAGYLAAARRIADTHGALLWIDEVQTGMGRTGAWFAHMADGVVPDIVTLAKALGNGFPVGAILARGGAATAFTPGLHGTTFGGNALACRVGLTVLEEIEPLLPQVVSTGSWLKDQLRSKAGVVDVRGRGLMLGVVLDAPIAANVVTAGLDAGFILNAPRPDVVRLVPPLVITRDELTELLDAWDGLVAQGRG